MSDLFEAKSQEERLKHAPLADRIRPDSFQDFVGQEHIIGEGKMLRQVIEGDEVPSMILWGPPGSGKTTLGRIIAAMTKSAFVLFHAVTSGVGELRRVIQTAEERQKLYGKRTILFVDEIHRWNKAQQDALLPYVENGTLTLIGATTENPSFEVIGPLLSRCKIYVLNPLNEEELKTIAERGLKELGFTIADDALMFVTQ